MDYETALACLLINGSVNDGLLSTLNNRADSLVGEDFADTGGNVDDVSVGDFEVSLLAVNHMTQVQLDLLPALRNFTDQNYLALCGGPGPAAGERERLEQRKVFVIVNQISAGPAHIAQDVDDAGLVDHNSVAGEDDRILLCIESVVIRDQVDVVGVLRIIAVDYRRHSAGRGGHASCEGDHIEQPAFPEGRIHAGNVNFTGNGGSLRSVFRNRYSDVRIDEDTARLQFGFYFPRGLDGGKSSNLNVAENRDVYLASLADPYRSR